MNSWETILDQYLEGTCSRAEAESLRYRLNLTTEERAEIEMTLRLADELLAAGQAVVPPPQAVPRLRERFRAFAAHALVAVPDWRRVGATYRPGSLRLPSARAMDAEETANAIIEGTTLIGDSTHPSLEQFREIAAEASDSAARPPLPEGAADRLLSRLRAQQPSHGGSCDPAVARRILRQLQSAPAQDAAANRDPDILAATKESEDEGPGKGEDQEGI